MSLSFIPDTCSACIKEFSRNFALFVASAGHIVSRRRGIHHLHCNGCIRPTAGLDPVNGLTLPCRAKHSATLLCPVTHIRLTLFEFGIPTIDFRHPIPSSFEAKQFPSSAFRDSGSCMLLLSDRFRPVLS